jgi:hypothetical protein
LEKIIKEKDSTIEKQRIEIINLRKKNFEFRSKITDMDDKMKKQEKKKQVFDN